MFESTNFTNAERISLSQEIARVGVSRTPLTSLLMAKGNIEKALSTVYTWREKLLSHDGDISAPEGNNDITFYESSRKELNNVLELFQKGAEISGTAVAMKQNQLAQEINDRLIEAKVQIEKNLINGVKDTGEVSGIRKMSGLIEFADPSNAIAHTGAVTEQLIKDAMRGLWNQELTEGQTIVLVNADLKDEIDAIYKDHYGYSHTETNFGLLVDSINTNFGKANFVLSADVPADQMVFFNDSYINLVALREIGFEPLAKVGDSTRGMVVGEYSVKVGSPKAVSVVTVTA